MTITQFTGAPIFDADQHMYETPESLTKYLPETYLRAVQFAQIGRHTRIVINKRVNDFIPNPTFERRQFVDLCAVPRFSKPVQKMPQNFPKHPHDVFRRNIWVSPFWEGCVADVVEFGSDYPHPEGLAEPKGFWRYAEGMDQRRSYDFMGDKARRFMGLPIANPDPDAVKAPAMATA